MPLRPLARYARSLPLRAPSITQGACLLPCYAGRAGNLLHCGRAPFQAVAGRLKPACTLLICCRLVDALQAYGLQIARVSRGLEPRFAPAVFIYVRWVPCALWGSRYSRGPPPRLRAFSPRPPKGVHALLRPVGRCPRYARAIRARCARALHYVTRESVQRASRGFPPLLGSFGAVALVPSKVGNLPLLAILMGSGSALAAQWRYAPPLKIQNKC